jgi:hypothetical protein
MPQQEMRPPHNKGDVTLFSEHGLYVATIALGDQQPPDVLVWRDRHFVRQFGAYREAKATQVTDDMHIAEAQR